MKKLTKILLSGGALLLTGVGVYIGYDLSQKMRYNPSLGNELHKEAIQIQEKYRNLKKQDDILNDFTQLGSEQGLESIISEEVERKTDLYYEYFKDPTGYLYLQRASFKKEESAVKLVKALRKKSFDVNYFKKDEWYVVYIGPLTDVNDVRENENKFYSLYPTSYVLLKGPINTDGLRIEKEKNLVRLSLLKFAGCMKKKNDCAYKYLSEEAKFEISETFEFCEIERFEFIPKNIDIDLGDQSANVNAMFDVKMKCYTEGGLEIIDRKNNRFDLYLKKISGIYKIQHGY